jgi:imidazolonepropionase-like amidohydrolase
MIFRVLAAVAGLFALSAQADTFLIQNVRIFDGVNEKLRSGHVLVENGLISAVSELPLQAPPDATVISGNNRILTPGFIELHMHLSLHYPPGPHKAHSSATGAYAVPVAKFFLDHGFTTVRDAGGTHPDLARAFNSGVLPGPRVFPAGAVVSQTSGHGDFRHRYEAHPAHTGGSPYMPADLSVLADGEDATLTAVRENLKNGATQIKIMGGGGVMSEYDPIHTLQPSPREIRAAVQAASDWDTYVMAHAYTAPAIRRLVENGVRSIEHGLLIDDETARFVADNDAVISTQLYIFRSEAAVAGMNDVNREKMQQVRVGVENLVRLIKKYGITTGFSTDFIYGNYRALPQEFLQRAEFWTPVEVLRQATSEGGKVIRMSGKLNRYGNFGEIREGWVADLLIFEGELLEDLSLIGDPDKNLKLIMKSGELVKNEL